MSRGATLSVTYVSDVANLRREWDELVAHIQRTTPRVNLTGATTGAAGTTGGGPTAGSAATATTFGGQTTISTPQGPRTVTTPPQGPTPLPAGVTPPQSPPPVEVGGPARATGQLSPESLRTLRAANPGIFRWQDPATVGGTGGIGPTPVPAGVAPPQSAPPPSLAGGGGFTPEYLARQRALGEANNAILAAGHAARAYTPQPDVTASAVVGSLPTLVSPRERQLSERLTQQANRVAEREVSRNEAARQRTERDEQRIADATRRRAEAAERAADREQRRIDHAAVRERVERTSDRRQRAAAYQEAADAAPEGSADQLNFQAQANREARRATVRDYFTGRFQGAAGIAFGIGAVAHLGNQLAGMWETNLRRQEDAPFTTQREELQNSLSELNSQGPLKSLAHRGISRAFGGAGEYARRMGLNSLSGWLGNVQDTYDDAGDRQRAQGALAILDVQKANLQRVEMGRTLAAGAETAWRAVDVQRLDPNDSLRQQIVSINTQQADAKAGRKLQRDIIREKLKDTELPAHVKAGLEADLKTRETFDAEADAASDMSAKYSARNVAWQFQRDTTRMEGMNTADRLGRAGYNVESAQAKVRAEYNPFYNASGQLTGFGGRDMLKDASGMERERFEAMRGAFQFALEAPKFQENMRVATVEGNIRSAQFALGGQQLEARLAGVKAQREALDQSGITNPDELRRQSSLIHLQEQQIKQDFRVETGGISRGLTVQNRQLNNALNRENPSLNAAIGVSEDTISQGVALTRSGHGDQAGRALENGQLRLDLIRQNYLDSFKGEQVDLRLVNTNAGRGGGEDVDKLLEGIAREREQLATDFAKAIADAVASD